MTIMYFNILTIFGNFFANCVVIFQKTEVQTVILEMFPLPFFCNFAKKMCVIFFCVFGMLFIFVITFESNKIQTRLAPQNNRLNVSFVKDIHLVGEKRNGLKTAI